MEGIYEYIKKLEPKGYFTISKRFQKFQGVLMMKKILATILRV